VAPYLLRGLVQTQAIADRGISLAISNPFKFTEMVAGSGMGWAPNLDETWLVDFLIQVD